MVKERLSWFVVHYPKPIPLVSSLLSFSDVFCPQEFFDKNNTENLSLLSS